MRIVLVALFFGVLIGGCNYTNTINTVVINLIDTSGIYFCYEYLGVKYDGNFPLDISDKDFSTGDSLRIKINKEYPDKYEFISVTYSTSKKIETTSVDICKSNSEEPVFGFHRIDKKPLFQGASDEYENDSVLMDFFRRNSNITGKEKKVGVHILIGRDGTVLYEKASTENNQELKTIRELVDKMPKFTSPMNNGDSVKVNYLIEVPVYVKTGNTSDALYQEE